jgi:hypothetical protein
MSLLGRPTSFAYAALLVGCAYLAAQEIREMFFWIVVSELPVPIFMKITFTVTIFCFIGFLVAAIACLSMRKVFSAIALASAVGFLPSAIYFFRQGIDSDTWKYRPSVAGVYVFALVLDVAALWLASMRVRQFVRYEKVGGLEAEDEDSATF